MKSGAFPTLAQRINRRASAANVPLSVVVELTYRCNLRCYFCYQKHARAAQYEELDLVSWRRIMRRLADAGVLYLTLTGGEPFMRKDILAIVAAARECSFAVSIISNGTLITRSIARSIAGLGVMDIGISLHAARSARHDRLSGVRGSFNAALAAVRALKEAGCRVMIKHTVSRENFGAYRDLAALAEREDCIFECDSFVVPDTPGSVSLYALSGAQHRRFCDDMKVASCFDDTGDSLHCDAGRSVAGITPSGVVVPCIQLPLPFGSLRRRSFSAIWNGKQATMFRQEETRLRETCERCAVRRFCSRCHGLAHAEGNDFRGPAPNCCVRATALQQRYTSPVAV